MDNELFSNSALAETFEWTDPSASGSSKDREVDVDMTMLKNLMESQSHAMGSPMSGPLSQLMAQLGINLPLAPPMNK
jgi:hypothetical protein